MCSGDVDSDGEKPTLRSLKELKADFERRRPRPVLRPLKELSLDYARQKRCAVQPQALRSLAELAADFQARAPAPAPAPAGESAACQELSGRPTYGRDELLAVLASMPLGPSGGDGGRGAGIQTIKFEAPPGLEPLGLGPAPVEQQEDPSLDDEALLARLEAREAREAGADRHNAETFGPHAEVEEVGLAEEDEADEAYLASLGLSYLIDDDEADSLCGARGDEESDKARRIKAEFLAQMDGAAWDLQPHQADGEAFEAQEFWWNMAAMDQQCYAEDMWDFSEGFLGYEHSSYWGYPQNMEGFQDGLLSGDMYFGLADKSSFMSMAKDPDAHLSSTAPSDAESGGEEAELPRELRQAICW